MISAKHKIELENFKKKIEDARPYLTGDWIQKILKKKKLSGTKYQKLYNMLVNWRAGRSYRSSLKYWKLFNEMIELANKYKEVEL